MPPPPARATTTHATALTDRFWEFYNLTDPGESGKFNCYCEAVFKGAPIGITPDQGIKQVEIVEFYNPEERITQTWCTDWYHS